MTDHSKMSDDVVNASERRQRHFSIPRSADNSHTGSVRRKIAVGADHRSGSPDVGVAGYPGAVPVAYAKARSCHFRRGTARNMPVSGSRAGERPDGNSGRRHAGFGRAASARLLLWDGLVFLTGDRQPDQPTFPTAARWRGKGRALRWTSSVGKTLMGISAPPASSSRRLRCCKTFLVWWQML